MKHLVTAVATIGIFGTALFVTEQRRGASGSGAGEQSALPFSIAHSEGAVVRAPGRIEGKSEEIAIRSRVSEQISTIHVSHGDRVHRGELLVSLDTERLESERDLAEALVAEASAREARVLNGYRPSEIEMAMQNYQAASARVLGAEKAYVRAERLRQSGAISQQTLDDQNAELNALRASAAAARASFKTVEAPPREDELMAAKASVRAAKSRLQIAKIELERAAIRSPIDGTVLRVDATEGELTGPDSTRPLLVLADMSKQRILAEVDEFDSLRVKVGQRCEVTCDARPGVVARGVVSEVEPRMSRKQVFGDWVGERADTFARRIWVDLEGAGDLPIGLPVEVHLLTKATK